MRTLLSWLIAVALAGCVRDGDDEPISASDPTFEPDRTAARDLPHIDLQAERSGLARWVEERERELDVKIDALERRGDDAARETAALLRAKRDQVRAKMIDLEWRTEATWGAFERDVQKAWDDLEREVQDAWLR